MERPPKSINADISKGSRQERMAENKNEEGNQLYREQKYEEAIKCYTEAIGICPSCATYYANRSAAHFRLQEYRIGLDDAQHSISLDPAYVKGYVREGNCHLIMGNISEASDSFQLALGLESDNAEIMAKLKEAEVLGESERKVNLFLGEGYYTTALLYLDDCLKKSPACLRWKVLRAEILVFLGLHREALEQSKDGLHVDDTLYIQGLSLYHQDNLHEAKQCLLHVFHFMPDHPKAGKIFESAQQMVAQRDAGKELYYQDRLQEAHDVYQQAVQIDPLNACFNWKLHYYCAAISKRLGKLDQAVQDITQAISLNKNYVDAYLMRGQMYMDLKKFEKAVRDYTKAFRLQDRSSRTYILQQLGKAKEALRRRSQPRDYYQILGVKRSATEEEIKAAYKRKALIHHPDRHSNASKEEQKKQEVLFKEVGEAYKVLSDRLKRAQYGPEQKSRYTPYE